MDVQQITDIGAVVLAVIAAATVSGPLIKLLVDGMKATNLVPSGYAGGTAVAIGLVVGLVFGVALVGFEHVTWFVLLVTGLGGLAAGAMAIGAHLAVTPGEPKPAGPVTTTVTTSGLATTAGAPAAIPTALGWKPVSDSIPPAPAASAAPSPEPVATPEPEPIPTAAPIREAIDV